MRAAVSPKTPTGGYGAAAVTGGAAFLRAAPLAGGAKNPHWGGAKRRVSLEALVTWAIRDQCADRDGIGLHGIETAVGLRESGIDASGYPMDSCARLSDIGDVGCRIDGGGAIRGLAPRMHRDAELVADAIRATHDFRGCSLVLRYARLGDRPEWLPLEQRLVGLPAQAGAGRGNRCRVDGAWEAAPLRSEIAREMVARRQPIIDHHGGRVIDRQEKGFRFRPTIDGKGREIFTRWCPLVAEPSYDEIHSVNEVYSVWHAAMMALLGRLMDAPLKAHSVTGFTAPATPWA